MDKTIRKRKKRDTIAIYPRKRRSEVDASCRTTWHGQQNTELENKGSLDVHAVNAFANGVFSNATTGHDLAVGRMGHARLKRRTKLRVEYGNRTRSSGTSSKS